MTMILFLIVADRYSSYTRTVRAEREKCTNPIVQSAMAEAERPRSRALHGYIIPERRIYTAAERGVPSTAYLLR